MFYAQGDKYNADETLFFFFFTTIEQAQYQQMLVARVCIYLIYYTPLVDFQLGQGDTNQVGNIKCHPRL